MPLINHSIVFSLSNVIVNGGYPPWLHATHIAQIKRMLSNPFILLVFITGFESILLIFKKACYSRYNLINFSGTQFRIHRQSKISLVELVGNLEVLPTSDSFGIGGVLMNRQRVVQAGPNLVRSKVLHQFISSIILNHIKMHRMELVFR